MAPAATLVTIEALLLIGGLAGWFDRRAVTPYVRVGAAAGFAVLLLAGVVGWAPRYYALAAWLLVLAVWSLRRPRREAGPMPPRRSVGVSAAVAGITLLAAAPALIFPEYTPLEPSGSHPVAAATFTFTDASRADPFSADARRSLTFEVWHPDVAGARFPLVVFSHGSMGTRTSNETLFGELASRGYIVASVDHPGHALYSRAEGGGPRWIDRGYLGELRREDAGEDPVQSLAYYRRWMEVRVGDIAAVVDHLLAEATRPGAGPPLALIDPDRIGLVGHSLGGSAVLGVGRVRDDIAAVVALEAPYMTEIVAVDEGRFVWNPEPYPVPVLNVYSDSAWGHLDEWPQYAMNQAVRQDSTGETVHIEGVGHLHLTDLSLASPFLTRVLNGHPSPGDAREALRELNGHVVDFLDVHLAGR